MCNEEGDCTETIASNHVSLRNSLAKAWEIIRTELKLPLGHHACLHSKDVTGKLQMNSH